MGNLLQLLPVRAENLRLGNESVIFPVTPYHRQVPCSGDFEFLHHGIHVIVYVDVFGSLFKEIPHVKPVVLAAVEHLRADVPKLHETLETPFGIDYREVPPGRCHA